MRPFTTGLGILALTASILVGCGGDDDAATTLREGETPEGVDDADDADDVNPLDGDDDSSGGGDDSSGDGDADAFCAEAIGIEERFNALEDTVVPDAEQFSEVSAAFEDLAEDAPEEIADDMDDLAGALGALADVFGNIDLEDPESLDVLEEESARLEEEFGDLAEAGDNVESYLREECGIDLGGDDGGADEGTAPDDDGTGTELDGEG